jgi:hypothetical protein
VAVDRRKEDIMAYPKLNLTEIAWHVLDRFLLDWQAEPFRWDREIDVQVEVASRLSLVFRYIGTDTLVATYPNIAAKQEQRWSRVSCEPRLTYTYSDGKQYRCHPDIVIWDDIKNPSEPPDATGERNWPMLWACEIKYGQQKPMDWDIEKLRYLMALPDGGILHGCWLRMLRTPAKSGSGIVCQRDQVDGRLWVYDVMLPAI